MHKQTVQNAHAQKSAYTNMPMQTNISSECTKCTCHEIYIYIHICSECELVSVVYMNRCVYNSGWVKRIVIISGQFVNIYMYNYIYILWIWTSVVDLNRCVCLTHDEFEET